ncbi:isochorismatase family protein [Ilumatobacter sp.]|uniref:isochorismatase family protein n=1 Tax=Ilumatobacter sp. TaxID=1967498 RepID=UPI003AF8392A
MPTPKQHRWRIAAGEYERHEARRGQRHAYSRLRAERSALVVIDMVPFFVDEHTYALGVVDTVNRLASGLRIAGGRVVWVVPAADIEVNEEFLGSDVAAAYRASGGVGRCRDRLWPALGVDDGDLFAEKSAPSAFFPGRSDLDERLRALGIDTVLIAGTVANVCCESSARDASTLGYRVVMVADANAANSDDELNATLHTVYRSFGDVRSTDEVLDAIASDRPRCADPSEAGLGQRTTSTGHGAWSTT